jgi:hypothetical protein
MLELVRTAKVDAACAGLVLVAVLFVAGVGQTAHSTEAAQAIEGTQATDPALLREGALIQNLSGQFQRQGNRLVFVAADGRRLTALENLNLQRVADKLEVDATFTWFVWGTVTEFRGDRFLLISRAQARRVADMQARRGRADLDDLR